MRNRILRLVLLTTGVLLLSSSAIADITTFDFSYVGSNASLTGFLTASRNGNGTYTANGGTAVASSTIPVLNGLTMTLYPIPDAEVPATIRTGDGTDLIGLDNLLLPSSVPMLDVDGLIFGTGTFTDGHISGIGFNIYSLGVYRSFVSGPGVYEGDTGTFTLSLVPEPGTVFLLLIMLSGVAALVLARRKKLV